MTHRERTEANERLTLSPAACFSARSRGRMREEEQEELRTCFQRDVDRIVHCKAFRRLKHKTQVFLRPEGDHYRTRMTHTLEVDRIARTIARGLRLNEDLTEAAALGHDLGHTPFGHAGERILNEVVPGGFRHNEQSLRVVDVLEKDGDGLNLTYEVRDGILNHAGNMTAGTFEGKIIKYADRFAYLNHDIDDALRAGIITQNDLPEEYIKVLGGRHSERINTLITDIISTTLKNNEVSMSEKIESAMMGLRQFMFDTVYKKIGEQDKKVELVIDKMYKYYYENPEKMPPEFINLLKDYDIDTVVCDYIASMTDGYILKKFNHLFVPQTW